MDQKKNTETLSSRHNINIRSKFKISSIIFCCFCTIGLVYQVIDVCESYFSYGTKSLIVMRLPLNMDMPGMSVCFRLEKILKRDKIEADKNISVPVAALNWTAFYLEVKKLSVREVFLYTPQVDEVLAKSGTACMVRVPGKFAVNYPYAKAKECYSMFNIKKYMQRQFMCYRFRVQLNDTDKDQDKNQGRVKAKEKRSRTNNTLLIDETSLTPNLPGLIYNVWLDNDLFGDVTLLTSFAHGDNTCPLFDSIFASSFEINHFSNTSFANLQVTPRSMRITRLPPPYDNMCHSYAPFTSRYQKILHSVRLASIKRLNVVPTLDHVYEDYEYPFMSPYFIRNAEIESRLRDIVNEFYVNDPECYISYYVTDMKSSLGGNVKVSVIWPQDVSLSIDYQPDKQFLDLIIYISSCVGLWFGATVIHTLKGTLGVICSVISFLHQDNERAEETQINSRPVREENFNYFFYQSTTPKSRRPSISAQSRMLSRSLSKKPVSKQVSSPASSSEFQNLIDKRIDTKLAFQSSFVMNRTLKSVDNILVKFEDRMNNKIRKIRNSGWYN